jgi:hypothetical protein
MYVDMLLDLAYSINIIFWECVVKSANYSVLMHWIFLKHV